MKRIILSILIIAVIIFIIITFKIFNKPVTTVIKKNDNLSFEYADKVYLYSLFTITDCRVTDDNTLIDTSSLGQKNIIINYKDSNNHKQKMTITYEVKDTTKPMLGAPSNVYRNVGSDIDLTKDVFCGDNYDRELDYGVRGDYDINTVGNYDITYYAKDSSGNEITRNSTLHVYKSTNSNTSTNTNNHNGGTNIDYYFKNYKQDNNLIGIDVSAYQKDIDFNKVKESGISFVIIRIGFGPNENGEMTLDTCFEDNYRKAKEAGLKIGIYLFSYATTLDEIDIQTKWVLDNLKDKEIDLGIAYDWESWSTFKTCKMNFKDLNDLAAKFLEEMKNHNYNTYNYGSAYYLHNIWDIDNYNTWIAQYYKEVTYNRPYQIWQITDDGIVDGIEGFVDVDILYQN